MALEIELNKIRESEINGINDAIRLKIDDSSIEEYPASGVHQFYIEAFEYKNYGYNIAINMFFNIQQFGEACCCKEALFLGVTPRQDPVTYMGVINYKNFYKKSNFLSFSQQVSEEEIRDTIDKTHQKAESQIDSLLEKQKALV